MARAIVIAAPTSTSGKTVVTLGLIRALRRQGLRVASAKVGPDYIDPRFHAHASGRPCPNLDPWAMGETGCAALLEAASGDADLIIIEGVMGLFDGPHGASGSTADLAAALGLPVVLVVDARHQSQSLAALVHGFATYRPDIALGGVIANRSAKTDEIDRFNDAVGLKRLAHFPDLDVVRRSRLKKSTLFEMESSPELDAVTAEYMRLAETLWAGAEPCEAQPMKDRDLFEFLGFD